MTGTDLRLVPLAVAAWLSAALLVGRAGAALVVAVLACLAAVALLVRARRRRARHAGRTALPGAVLCLVGVTAVAGVVAADAGAARSELLAGAALDGTPVTVDVLVTGEPRALPSMWGGPTRYGVDVRVERVRADGSPGDVAHGGAVGGTGEGADVMSGGSTGGRTLVGTRVVKGSAAPVGRAAGARTEEVALPARLVGERWADVVVGERVRASATVTARGHDGRRARYDLRGATTPRQIARAGPLRRAAYVLRAGLRTAVADLPADAAALVPGLAVGDTSALPDDLDEAMRTTGLTHLTAVSGAHFSLVGALVLAGTAVLRVPRRPRAVVTALVLAGLVVLVGPDPSVLRAAGTGAIGLLALALGRRGAAVPALAAGVVVLLLLDPWLARSAGLALSVAATAGLVVGGPLVLGGVHGARRWLAAAVVAPVLAQLACAPVLVLLTPSLPTWSLPANIVTAPVVAPTTVLGLGATLVAPVLPGAAAWLATLAGYGAGWIAGTARTIAAWPGASLPWWSGATGAVLLVVIEAALVAGVVHRVRRARGRV